MLQADGRNIELQPRDDALEAGRARHLGGGNQPSSQDYACWICMESGGDDLIVACQCKSDGVPKRVHRHCLDRWRVSRVNPRAFTNCPNCGAAYVLVLERSASQSEDDVAVRRRRLLGRLVGHFILGTMITQCALCLIAMLIRLVDTEEALVDFFSLPCAQCESGPHTGNTKESLMHAVYHRKTTYYLAAFLVSAFLVGLGTVVTGCFVMFCKRGCGSADCRECECDCHNSHMTVLDYIICHDMCECISDCMVLSCRDGGPCTTSTADTAGTSACNDCACCGDCSAVDCDCKPDCPAGGDGGCDCNGDCGALVAGVLIVIAVALIFVGVFVFLVALVWWMQRGITRYFQVREIRALTGEYVVQDLSECGGAPPPTAPPPIQDMEARFSGRGPQNVVWATDPNTEQSLTRDLQAIYGISYH